MRNTHQPLQTSQYTNFLTLIYQKKKHLLFISKHFPQMGHQGIKHKNKKNIPNRASA